MKELFQRKTLDKTLFLNVIESVFSGMAKAIIHNSDYKSVSDKAAIDRYFSDRNEKLLKIRSEREIKSGAMKE